MSYLSRMLLITGFIAAMATACASGRVRGGQGTEMQQAEEYQPGAKVDPPEGNVDRTSGPITSPTPPPVLEVDLERRQRAPGPAPEPEPEPDPKPKPGNDPE